MRKLGQELGVEAMSLYNHVANKDDILDGIADTALSEIVLPTGEDDWKTAVRGIAISVHDDVVAPPVGDQPLDEPEARFCALAIRGLAAADASGTRASRRI